MPLVRIDLRAGKAAEYRAAIGEVIYDALLGIGVPVNDRFQIITEHPRDFRSGVSRDPAIRCAHHDSNHHE